jgi:hypothetical protein
LDEDGVEYDIDKSGSYERFHEFVLQIVYNEDGIEEMSEENEAKSKDKYF